jgi:hypothetical protein
MRLSLKRKREKLKYSLSRQIRNLAQRKYYHSVHSPFTLHSHFRANVVLLRTEKKEKREDTILSKLNKFGQQFMESVDAIQQKPKKKGKKAAIKPEIESTGFVAIDTMDNEEEDISDDKDEIDQLFGIGKRSVSATR